MYANSLKQICQKMKIIIITIWIILGWKYFSKEKTYIHEIHCSQIFNAKYIFHQEFMTINQKNKYAVKELFQEDMIQRLPNVAHGPVNKNLKPMKHFKTRQHPLT